MNKKQAVLTTELFNGKQIPDYIKNHAMFKTPYKVQKVFPSVGLANFSEKANIDKCLFDVKKEGTYVHNLLRIMSQSLKGVNEAIRLQADRIQWLETSKEAREKHRTTMKEQYDVLYLTDAISKATDPYVPDVMDNAVHINEGKVSLKLMHDIPDPNNSAKVIFKKDQALFSIYTKLQEKCNTIGVALTPLDKMEAFKIFSKENVPNKEYSVVFSSTGIDGAWDIATMSMRGEWSSCQRWDGEYKQCIIGSLLSKFVGIIYLTSGVMNTANEKNGGRASLGTKMMKRCIVRFAIDADEKKPCIMIDKMYPDFDKDILEAFTTTLKSKTSLPVYYAPDMGNKLKHMYLPAEEMRQFVSDREWSYQDNPIKSRSDLDCYILNNNKDEVDRETNGFKANLAIFLARRLERVSSDYASVDPEVKKVITNIRMNTSFTPFCVSVANHLVNAFRAPPNKEFVNSRNYYKRYLMEFLSKRKQTLASAATNLSAIFKQNTSRTFNEQAFIEYLSSLTTEFTKHEIKSLIN